MPPTPWPSHFPCAITVTDENGVVIEMNEQSRSTFAKWGGAELIGRPLADCHNEKSRRLLESMFAERRANHYTITKNGQRRIIHQLPWFHEPDASGERRFGGFVELGISIPHDMPHFDRDQPVK